MMNCDNHKAASLVLHDLVVATRELYADHEPTPDPDLENAERLADEFVEVVPEPYYVPLNSLAGATPSTFYEVKKLLAVGPLSK